MKRHALVLALLLAACSGEKTEAPGQAAKPAVPDPPAASALQEQLASSADFAEYQFTNASITIPVDAPLMNESARDASRQLASENWVRIDENGNVGLTEKSGSDKRFVLRPNGMLDIVPLAKKQMGQAGEVVRNPDGTISLEFTWTWNRNEVGQALTSGMVHDRLEGEQKARATFIWDGSGWMILKIEPV